MTEDKKVQTIKVPDMSCQHCKNKITDALRQMPGIQSVSIDLNTREVTVESVLDRQLILDRIKQAGYQPQ